jgi:Secretion system C-terminal sorting domain
MKKITTLFCSLFCFALLAQEKYDLPPCGTPASLQSTDFSDLDFARNGGDTVLYVPLTLHQMMNDNGAGLFYTGKLLDAFNRLNSDYAPTKIQWFIEGDIQFIKNTATNSHKTVPEGANMMFKYNVPNTLNVYVCSDAAGNCGYSLPYGGVALAKSCTGPNDHTWAHELGHSLRLPHPFLGWESKKVDFSKPTPTKVTYDYTLFKDSLILNQTIIDTALVELVDKSNCAKAADQICDTKPDYISYRWSCDSKKESLDTYKDPDGVSFKSDGTLYMSYSLDDCQNRFSDGEIAVMRSWLLNKKKNWLYNQVPKPALPQTSTTLLFPADKGIVAPDNALLKWEKLTNATQYVVDISRISSFSTIEFEYITNKTELILKDLTANKTYYWRVRGFHSHNGGIYTPKQTFLTGEISSVKNLSEINDFVVFPNPIEQDELTVKINTIQGFESNIQVSDFTGKIIAQKNINLNEGEQNITFQSQNWSKGIYFISISNKTGGIVSKKIVKL